MMHRAERTNAPADMVNADTPAHAAARKAADDWIADERAVSLRNELADAITAACEPLAVALRNCILLLEPDTSLEDMRYRAANRERLIAEAKAALRDVARKGENANA